MEREVFILPDGEAFSAWDLRFCCQRQHQETCPCIFHERDGSVREGNLMVTVESADVTFSACQGSLKVGQKGQLSSSEDRFFEVEISSVEPIENYLLVSGRATKRIHHRP